MKRLVYINQVANYLSEGIVYAMLNKGGYDEVILLIGNPDNVSFTDPRVKIKRIAPYNRSSFVKRTKSWILGTLQIQWLLWTKYRKAEVFLVSNPPTAAFAMALVRNRYKSLIYDIYPDGLVAGGFLGENNIGIKFWKSYNKRFFRKAERVFTITDGMAQRLSAYVDKSKIEIVPIWSNPALHRIEKSDNEFIREHHLEDKFVVMYSGNIGKGHNVSLLPEIANILRHESRIQFVIIGEGWEKNLIIDRIRELDLHNILVLPYQPIDKVSQSLSAADLSYISVDEKASSVCIPSKTFNCIAVGSALLCVAHKDAAISTLVKNRNIGKRFDSTDTTGIANFIMDCMKNRNRLYALQYNIDTVSKELTQKLAELFI